MAKFYLIILIFILCSCEQSQENIVREYYYDGSLRFEYQINKDSIMDGFFKEYYPEGSIRSIIYYENGNTDSIATFYYENGSIEKTLNFCNDTLLGSQIRFYPNNKIKQYSVIDGFGECFFVLKYDSIGNQIKREGGIISQNIYCNICKNGFVEAGQVASIYLACSTPPNTTTEVYYGEISNPLNSKKYERLLIRADNLVPHEISFSKKGIYKFYFLGILKNLNGDIISKDSIYQDIVVK
jgi:hypothetical protein